MWFMRILADMGSFNKGGSGTWRVHSLTLLLFLLQYLGQVGCIRVQYDHIKNRPRVHNNEERRLFDDLLYSYDEGTRPVLNANTTVHVNFSLSLHQIMDLDERNQTLISHVWINEQWVDEILRWDPAQYGGLESAIMPAQLIWVPDIYIFNNAEKGDEGFVMVNDSRAMVHYDGRVEWIVPLMIKSSCAVDVIYFPFDNQRCFVRFGSWIYDSEQLDLVQTHKDVDMSNYVTNSEHDLLSITLERQVMYYEIFAGKYPQITMYLHIRRRPLYYLYTVVAPTLVLCFLSLFSFMLPCDNGAKVGIGLTVFLSLYVLQLAIAENIPESNSLPLIGLFLTLVMTLNSISLLCATLVINIKKKGERKPCPEVPPILLKLCSDYLAKVTCTRMLNFWDFYDICDPEEQPSCSHDYDEGTTDVTSAEEDTEDISSPDEVERLKSQGGGMAALRVRRRRMDCVNKSEIKKLNPTSLSSKQFTPRDLKLEWYFVATVVDKFLFMLFLVGMTLTIFLPLVIIPYIHRND